MVRRMVGWLARHFCKEIDLSSVTKDAVAFMGVAEVVKEGLGPGLERWMI